MKTQTLIKWALIALFIYLSGCGPIVTTDNHTVESISKDGVLCIYQLSKYRAIETECGVYNLGDKISFKKDTIIDTIYLDHSRTER